MSKIIVTAFLPFGSITTNSSLEIVKLLKNDVIKKELSVDWTKTISEITNILEENCDYLILCGQAASYKQVSIEKVAINLMDANIPDNDGKVIKNKVINRLGPDAYFSNIDVISLVDKVKTKYNEIRVSFSAGTYICNLAYYTSLDKIHQANLKTKVIFVHFPLYKCQIDNNDTPSIECQKMVDILEEIINNIKDGDFNE